MEVTINSNGLLIRGEEESNDLYTDVDLVVEKLEKQLEKYKTRFARRYRGGVSKDVPLAEAPMEAPVRIKKVPARRLSPEDAIMEMNLLGHDFFIFLNEETEAINVVYKRKDGAYGLIETE
jgi:putative sigma-54 modulation protein